jgi:glycosyltransferase involved in cell wall biosynthesis
VVDAPAVSVPRVTVLMAVRNGEEHLRESLASVLAQTLDDFELLIVDDASTDGSMSIVAEFGDPRIRVIRNEVQLGLARSLNIGLAAARAELVARQDDDDVSDPIRLALQVARLEERPSVALVACAYRRIDDAGRIEGHRPVPLDVVSIRWHLLFLNAFTHSSVVFRRAVVQELGGYAEDLAYAEDYELWSRLAESYDVEAVPQRLVSYRRASCSMTASYKERSGGQMDKVAEISRRNIGRVLGDMGAADRFDRDTARALLFGRSRAISFRRAVSAAGQILELEGAFARSYGLDRRARSAHRARVAIVLARRLAAIGLARS